MSISNGKGQQLSQPWTLWSTNTGQVNLSSDDPEDVDPVTVFEQVTDFGNLLSLIRGQSELYMKQKGIPFATNEDELRAFLGTCLVMGYHVLPSIRDYWSTQPDLHMPFVASTVPWTRFEAIRAALHFSDNEKMLRPTV